MADKIIIELDLEKGDFKTLEDDIGRSGKKAGRDFSNKFSNGLRSATAALAKLGAAASAVGSIVLFKSVKDAAQLEVINTQFEVMLKSASAAKKQVQDLQDFAASTPFQLTGLAEATKQLLSFGVTQKEIIPTLTKLGDIAAGVGADITDLTIPFGRLVSTQKLTLQELDKFADRGVNIYAELAKESGVSIKSIRDDISKGRVPFELFTKSLENMTGETGLFFQGMKKQSATLTGVMSTLGDNLFNLSASFGKAFSPVVIAGANKIIEVVKRLTKEVQENFNLFNDVLIPLSNFSDSIITFVISPLELMGNILSTLQSGLNTFVSGIVASFGVLAGEAGKLISLFAPESEVAMSLRTFAESTAEVFDENAAEARASLDGILDFPVTEKLAAKNEEFRLGLQELNAAILEESELAKTNLDGSLANSNDKLNESLTASTTKLTAEMRAANAQVNAIVKGGIVNGISGGIQTITKSLIAGENAFSNFGNFILGTFGDLAIQLGQFFIAQGIAIEALNAVSGTGAIAAGVGLIALGTLLKSFTSSGGSSGGSTSGVAAVGAEPAPGQLSTNLASTEDVVEAEERTNLSLNIEGSLVRESELNGFISDILEEGSSKNATIVPSLKTGFA